jgi:hypothetical protein
MAFRDLGNKPKLVGGAVAAGPSENDVLVDGGAVIHGGNYTVSVIVGATVSALFTIARRNAANDDDVTNYVFSVFTGAGASSEFIVSLPLEVSERVVVRAGAANAGNNYAAINLEHLT